MRQIFACLISSVLLLPLSVGCGGGKMGDVRGKLLYKGKPVTTGVITFMPKLPEKQMEGGKPSSGIPDENGEFRLSTFARNDGALVGTHTVVYAPPIVSTETEDKEVIAKQMKQFAQFGKLKLPAGHTVEVKAGRNDITLNLID